MKYLKSIVFISGLICLSSFLNLTFAQSGGSFEIKQSVIANGGGSGAGGTFSLDGTIGQTLAGTTSNGVNFTLISGFWGGGASSVALHDAPFDFDGDNKTDISIFRPSVGEWWYLKSSTGGNGALQFGSSTDKLVPGDFTGDGKADIAIWRPIAGEWWYSKSSTGQTAALQFGLSTDKPVPGDYTGDGRADIAFFRPSTGFWFILRSEDFSFFSFPFGTSGDVPAPGDYDGDGKFDTAVFRPSNSTWFLNQTTSGVGIVTFGITGDQPVPNAFVP